MFVDRVRIHARGGSGGAGVASFKRQRGKPKGKPIGGDGGDGGDVYLVADGAVATLLALSHHPHQVAADGSHGEGDLRHGRRGDDLVVPVPLGTVVRDDAGVMLADLVEPGQRVLVARGGKGGRGNASFVSTARRAPGFAEQGEYGEEASVVLELKLMADAALIGFPNAGKSTLIGRVSAAKPKIAEYPFTTLEPNLGVVTVGDREFVLADIPGLIEGAAEGKGLGHEFLRHTERARALVILLDPTEIQERTYPEQYEILQRELAEHSPDLAARPQVVAVNKRDAIPDPRDVLWWGQRNGLDLHVISAVVGDGLDVLMHAVADAVETAEREAPDRQGYVLHRPLREGFTVTRRGSEWVVSGKAAERAVRLDDLTDPSAADFAARRLTRIGVDDALREAGAEPGDDVRIGDLVFTYDPELVGADADADAEEAER